MIQYNTLKPKVYVETTVVSYLVARPSEEIQVKEKIDTRVDPVLEECYRMKEAFAAKFNSMQELYDYLVAETEKNKALGWKYFPLPQPQDEDDKEV